MAKLYNLDKYSGRFKIEFDGIEYVGKTISVKQAIQYAQKLKDQQDSLTEYEKLQEMVDMIMSCINIPRDIIEDLSSVAISKLAQLIQTGELVEDDLLTQSEGGDGLTAKNLTAE